MICYSNLEGHEASVVTVAFSPDSSYITTGSTLGDIRIWDARFGHGRHLALEKEAHDLGVTCCQFSPGIGAHGTIIWSRTTTIKLSCRLSFAGPNPEVGGSCMYLMATGGNDNLVKLWRVTANVATEVVLNCYTVMEGHTSNVMCLNFTPNGGLLASGYIQRTLQRNH